MGRAGEAPRVEIATECCATPMTTRDHGSRKPSAAIAAPTITNQRADLGEPGELIRVARVDWRRSRRQPLPRRSTTAARRSWSGPATTPLPADGAGRSSRPTAPGSAGGTRSAASGRPRSGGHVDTVDVGARDEDRLGAIERRADRRGQGRGRFGRQRERRRLELVLVRIGAGIGSRRRPRLGLELPRAASRQPGSAVSRRRDRPHRSARRIERERGSGRARRRTSARSRPPRASRRRGPPRSPGVRVHLDRARPRDLPGRPARDRRQQRATGRARQPAVRDLFATLDAVDGLGLHATPRRPGRPPGPTGLQRRRRVIGSPVTRSAIGRPPERPLAGRPRRRSRRPLARHRPRSGAAVRPSTATTSTEDREERPRPVVGRAEHVARRRSRRSPRRRPPARGRRAGRGRDPRSGPASRSGAARPSRSRRRARVRRLRRRARSVAPPSPPTISPIIQVEDHRGDDLGRLPQDPDRDRRHDVERAGQLAIGHRHEADRAPGEGDHQGHVRDRAGRARIRQRRHAATGGPLAPGPQRGDVLVERHDPDRLGLERRGQPGTADQQPATPRASRATGRDHLAGDRPERDRRHDRSERRWRARPAWAARRSAATTRTIPPRIRKAASASGQVAGVASVTSSAPMSAARRFTGRGWPTAPDARQRETRGEDLEPLERRLDQRDLLAVAGEVAVAERLLGQLEVRVGVVDQARHVGRQRRSTGVADGAAARSRASGVGRPGSGHGDGGGVGFGRGAGLGRQQESERVAQGRAPDDLARRRHDDPRELRERRPGRLEVDRLEIDEGVVERQRRSGCRG